MSIVTIEMLHSVTKTLADRTGRAVDPDFVRLILEDAMPLIVERCAEAVEDAVGDEHWTALAMGADRIRALAARDKEDE